MDKVTAEALWGKLRDGFNDLEATLIEIIKNKAWEPLGYASFTDAWNERLGDCRLANRSDMLRSHVVYAMLDEGLSVDEVVVAAKVPDSRVRNLKAAKGASVPVERAAGYKPVVSKPIQKVEVKELRLVFDAEELAYWRSTLSDKILLNELAIAAVRSRLNGACYAIELSKK